MSLKKKSPKNEIELLFKTIIQGSFLEIKIQIYTFFILRKISQEWLTLKYILSKQYSDVKDYEKNP